MKYGVLFLAISLLLLVSSCRYGGWYLLAVWPGLGFGTVASGYLAVGPAVYGKSQTGRLARGNLCLLLPYLIYCWSIWSLLRYLKSENASDPLTDDIWIGRRLLNREFPDFVDHVVDLTCEFSEPQALRAVDYHSMPVLDGAAPSVELFRQWVSTVARLPGKIYIHCAEGHGRTGMFAAALLVQLGHSRSVADALVFIKEARPAVRLGSQQRRLLTQWELTRE